MYCKCVNAKQILDKRANVFISANLTYQLIRLSRTSLQCVPEPETVQRENPSLTAVIPEILNLARKAVTFLSRLAMA